MKPIVPPPRDGFALVTALLVVLVLSVLAVGVAWIASSERRSTFAASTHSSAQLAADAGTEAGIHFLRVAEMPPAVTAAGGVVMTTGTVPLQGSQTFAFDCEYTGRSFRPGWGIEYPDFDYRIRSQGNASIDAESRARVLASRMFRMGY
ncbi:MAG TPA: PilX N-terminal domain-containing pilus assembly protein [Candidatus Krumholzibacteria bacterium]|nr:PilX N-terminal domain-containing pilus assembly protein [Candidatus Krumholzibacteria bacterium]